jgi:DNA-binding transcriptional regulator YhcF (GntR family)
VAQYIDTTGLNAEDEGVMIDVDPAGAVPPYEQVRVQLATMISAGTLPAGTRLPTIRALADDLDLAPGTVARAYSELERAALVTSRRRHGTIVSAPSELSESTRVEQLDRAARAYALAAYRLGAGSTAAVKALRGQLEVLAPH